MGVSAPGRIPDGDRALLLDWERDKVGDRLAGFATLLPAEPSGAVLMAVTPVVGVGLGWRFSNAVLLARPNTGITADQLAWVRSIWWDGEHLPVRPGSAGLVIVDSRRADPELLRSALAPGGTMAVLGREGDLVVYPDVDRPEHLWHRGWPVPARPSWKSQFGRSLRLHTGLGRELVRLSLDGPSTPTFGDRLLRDLEQATGAPGRLIGIQTAGDTILRVRQADGDVAVRVALTDSARTFDDGTTVAAEVPGVRSLIQQPIAQGVTSSAPWIATRWFPRRRRSVFERSRLSQRQWAAAVDLAQRLQAAPTGATDADWARDWCDGVAPIIDRTERDRLIVVLERLDTGMPTGWAHGDLWPGNVLVDRDEVVVIDWDNAARNAPLGLDWLLMAAMQVRLRDDISIAAACAQLVDLPDAIDEPIGGRMWSEWERPQRGALATAAVLLHLRNRAMFDLGADALSEDVEVILAALDTTAPAEVALATADPGHSGAAGQAARGALWLGASALVVKASQTFVLLVLAAILAPSALGVIAIGTLVLNISTVLGDLGTSSALVYWRGDARRAARSAVTVALGLSLAITALAWVFAPALVSALRTGHDGIGVIRGLTIVLPCYGIATAHLELMRRDLKFVRRIIPDLVATIAGTAVSIVLVVQGHGVAAFVVGQIVQGVLTLLVALVVAGPVMPGWSWTDVRGLVSYGGHLSGSNLAQLALLNVDYLFVSRLLGSTALGQYSLAFRLAYLPYLNIAYVIGGAAFPYLCRLRGEKLGSSSERITSGTITAVLPVCTGIALLANQLQLLGTKWAPAVPVVRWLMVYAVILSVAQLVQIALNSSGRPRVTLGLRLLHLLALFVALAVLASHGITAVAIAQVLAVGLVGASAAGLAARSIPGFSMTRLLLSLWPAGLGAAAMCAVILGLNVWIPGPQISAVRLAVLGVAGLAAYAVPVWMFDRERLRQTAQLLRSGR